jgi:CBS domain-containing protein
LTGREVSLAGLTAGDVMAKSFQFIGSRELVTKARAVMRESGRRVLPVVDGGVLEGILTQREILQVSSTKSNIPVSGIMSPVPVIITPASDLGRVVRAMIEFGLDELPVVQDQANRTFVGVVRADDIIRRMIDSPGFSRKVCEVMTRNPVSCEPDDELARVWEVMEKSSFSGMPVVEVRGGKRRVVGLITRSDIIKEGSARISEESGKGRRTKVRSVMRSPAITVDEETSLREAAEIMLERKIKRLPVVRDGELTGIISREDVLRAMCR